VVASFKSVILADLKERWQVLTDNIPDALLLTVYLDSRVKDFSFIEDSALKGALLKKAQQTANEMLYVSFPCPSQDTEDKDKDNGKEKEGRREEKLIEIFGASLVRGNAGDKQGCTEKHISLTSA
jgi:hypothetical protein